MKYYSMSGYDTNKLKLFAASTVSTDNSMSEYCLFVKQNNSMPYDTNKGAEIELRYNTLK